MLRYSIALLLGLANAAQPITMEDDGSSSIQLYLKRNDKEYPSYFYYPFHVAGKTYNLQPSSFENNVAIVGSECTRCSGMTKTDLPHIDAKDAGEHHYKDFNDKKADTTGFYYKPFRGDYV